MTRSMPSDVFLLSGVYKAFKDFTAGDAGIACKNENRGNSRTYV
ncbi:MAG TPA: hypothetical protein VKM55_04365 [Candidatus Lokiarchaeia archaeon]|nr:hypothetical protein [Candidatus Lokiarchaeia archaeon]